MAAEQIPDILIFEPTWEEFKDFNKYVEYMESVGAHLAGIAKIIPPPEYIPRKAGYDIENIRIKIPKPVRQVITGCYGIYQQQTIPQKTMTVLELKKLSEQQCHQRPACSNLQEIDVQYWRNMAIAPPIYGADVNATLFDNDVEDWNLNRLPSILNILKTDCNESIEGVNSSFLYFGMWKTSFPFHTEDRELYSINYLHFGEPKTWYCVPPQHANRLEKFLQTKFKEYYSNCRGFIRHKIFFVSPKILHHYGIPVNKITQTAGEIIINWPRAYHMGYNHGFNCAEATNFATEGWIDFGKEAVLCHCSDQQPVNFDMEPFLKRYRPEEFNKQ